MELEKNLMGKLIQSISGSFFDKIYDANWSIKIIQIVLFIDIVLLWQVDTGIVDLTLDSIKNFNKIGLLIIFVLIFSVMISYILPLIRNVLAFALTNYAPIVFEFFGNELNNKYDKHISPIMVHDFALKNRDTLLLNLYKEYEQDKYDKKIEEKRTKNLLFNLVVIVFIESFISIVYTFSGLSFFQWIQQVLGENFGWTIFTIMGIITFILLISSLDDRHKIYNIKCSSIYDELVGKDKIKSG